MGPKIWSQKFSHIILKWCYFMHYSLFCKKHWNSWIQGHFPYILPYIRKCLKMAMNSWISAFFAKQTAKMHKITSFEGYMRKFLRPKIWSQGTPLGSLGPLSQKAPDQRFPKLDFLLIWDPYDFPKLVAWETQAEKLKMAGARCAADSLWSCASNRTFQELKTF